VNDQADDISAISEAVSRQNLANSSFVNDGGDDRALADKMNALECNAEDCSPAHVKDDTSAEENVEDPNIKEAEAIADNVGPTSITSIDSVPDTTMYTESFHSDNNELNDAKVANNAISTINSQVEMQGEDSSTGSYFQKSEISHGEPSDTPRSISSHSSDGGYTASFCTEE
jgi:hypothetical protein